jgi:hypothetical protein
MSPFMGPIWVNGQRVVGTIQFRGAYIGRVYIEPRLNINIIYIYIGNMKWIYIYTVYLYYTWVQPSSSLLPARPVHHPVQPRAPDPNQAIAPTRRGTRRRLPQSTHVTLFIGARVPSHQFSSPPTASAASSPPLLGFRRR